MRSRAILLAVALVATAATATDDHGRELVYVEDRAGDDVTVIDAATLTVVNKIKVGMNPNGVEVSRTGDRVYVSVGTPPSIVAIDTETDEILWRVPVSGIPHLAAATVDGAYLYVPLVNADFVEVIDTRSRKVIGKVKIDSLGLHYAVACLDGNHVYISPLYGEKLTVIDARTRQVLKTIPTHGMVRPIDITRDEKRAYLAISALHGFQVMDLERAQTAAVVPLPRLGGDAEPVGWPFTVVHGLRLSPNNQRLVVTSVPTGTVAIYSVPDHKLLGQVGIGKSPNWISFSRDGKTFYVSNAGSGDVSVVSLEQMKETRRIQTGNRPQHLATVVAARRRTTESGPR